MNFNAFIPRLGIICGLSCVIFPVGIQADPSPGVQQKDGSKSAAARQPVFTDPKEVGLDYSLQGEYAGQLSYEKGQVNIGFQVIALGNGEFHGVFYYGGLPGAGWDKKIKYESGGKRIADEVVFQHPLGSGRVRDGQFTLHRPDGNPIGLIAKVERKSSTLGATPPAGAVVLFDGTNADAFTNGKVSPEGWLMEGSDTIDRFGDCELHLEFRTPFMPTARGQARGNSGCYLQSRYEVQILDSFGRAGKDNECGGIYETKAPDVNMCLPPLAWQTYDITYKTAKFNDAGTKTADARITVRQNGVVVQDDVSLPKSTRAAPLKEGSEPGPLHLQNHGNPVRFRNIWLEKK